MTNSPDEQQSLWNGNVKPEIVSANNKPKHDVPIGDQKKAILRQELMVLLICLGMLVGGMSLALPAVTLDQLTNPSEFVHLDKSQSSWYASASSIACPVGSFSSVFFVDKLGRKKSMALVNVLAIISWALMATATYSDAHLVFLQLLASRLLSGIATGMGGSPAGVYGAEICLPKIRALLIMAVSMAIAGGVLFAYVVGYFIRNDWRLIGLVFLGYQIACLILLIPIKESPSWLLSRGRIDEAKASISYFRGLDDDQTHQEVESEFEELKQQVRLKAGEKKASFLKSLRLPEVYRPFILALIYFIFQQFSGTFVVIVYAVQIITKAGVDIDPFLCAIYVGIARFFVSSFIMSWELNKWGHRPVGIFSAASTAVCLFLLAGSSWFTWLQMPSFSAVVIIAFVVASAGLWTIPFIILPEIFPQKVRGAFSGASIGCAYLISFISIKAFPNMLDWMGNGNVFAFYGCMALLTILFVYRFIPETKGKSFREIEEYFRSGRSGIQENEAGLELKEIFVKMKTRDVQ